MENRRDYFAGLAMQALISKFPLLDKEGELGIKKTDEELQELKIELAKSAWGYADYMIYIDSKKP